MPLQWRLQVLETQVLALTGKAIRFEETDLYRLQGGELEAVLTGMARGAVFPVALIGTDIVCEGGLDADAIVGAIERHTT